MSDDRGRPAWIEALAQGKEPIWTPLICGALALIGWLGPTLIGLPSPAAAIAYIGAYVAGGTLSLVRTIKSLAKS